MDATHELFGNFIDYAGLFPPAELAMAPAVEEYACIRNGPHGWMAGRFIVPASRAFEFTAALDPESAQAYPLCVVIDTGTDARDWMNAVAARLAGAAKLRTEHLPLTVEAIEAALPAATAARDTYDAAVGQFGMLAQNADLRAAAVYLEIPRTGAFESLLPGAMAALKRSGFYAKLRCGGVTQDAFPSSAHIAAFVMAATQADVAFKATAGLHHPVRARDAGTGLDMHGFLNLLTAVLAARAGAEADELTAIMDERDEAAFVLSGDTFSYRRHTFSKGDIATARRNGLRAYGSCSFEEPVTDLTRLGILAHGAHV